LKSNPSSTRRQLTLFVAEPWRSRLNALRHALDPVQASLISAHVTLCREDELEHTDHSLIASRVESWQGGPIDLRFGRPERFAGHGVLLPGRQGVRRFHQLRQWLLQDPEARQHAPHLTLAHPRNPRFDGNTDASLRLCPQALRVRFTAVALIEQQGGNPWKLVQEKGRGQAFNL
jgi:hypothetical protein